MSREFMWGCVDKKVEIWMDSALESVGWIVIRVTLQLEDDNIEAKRRNGIKCPIPALGHIATCG